MAIAVVQTLAVDTGHVSSHTTSAFGSSPTLNNTIIAVIGIQGTATVTSVSDNAGNFYTRDIFATTTSGYTERAEIWRCTGIFGGSGFQITFGLSGTAYVASSAIEVSGLAVSPLDGSGSTATGVNNVTQPNSGAITTANANDLIVLCQGNGQLAAITDPAGYTRIGANLSNGSAEDFASAYKIVSATQSGVTISWSGASSNAAIWAACAMAYKEFVASSRNMNQASFI